jgi:RecA-family ATPase
VEIVETRKPRLLVLDTLADVFAGNENARSEARQFIGLLRGLAIDHGLAVVLVAHPSLFGMATGSGTSGSTAWSNSVRSRLYLEIIKGEDGREIDADLRVLRVMKANYARAGHEVRLRWRDGCFILEGSAGGFDKLVADTNAENVFLHLLAAFTAQGRDVSPNVSNTYAPAVFEKHPDGRRVNKKQFASAMERLLTAKRICVEPVGPPSRRYSRLLIAPTTEEP